MRKLGTVLAISLPIMLGFAFYVSFSSTDSKNESTYQTLMDSTAVIPEDDLSWLIYNVAPCADRWKGFMVTPETKLCFVFNTEGKAQGILSIDFRNPERFWFCGSSAAYVTCFDSHSQQLRPTETMNGTCGFMGTTPSCEQPPTTGIQPNTLGQAEAVNAVYDDMTAGKTFWDEADKPDFDQLPFSEKAKLPDFCDPCFFH